MNVKAKIGVAGLFAVIAVSLALLAALSSESLIAQAISSRSGVVQTNSYDSYVLRDYDGYIGIYYVGDSSAPVTVTDIETGSLRSVDREMLTEGIYAGSQEELLSLLEDLGS